MLELKNNIFEDIQDAPKEHYTFQFEPDTVSPVEKKYVGYMKKRMLFFIIIGIIIMICGIFSDRTIVGFAIGVLFVGIVGHIKGVLTYKSIFTKGKEKYKTTLYDYTLYDSFLIIWISSKNSIRQMNVKLDEIKKLKSLPIF